MKNVLHGLHYQIQQSQGNLVRIVPGEVFDLADDIRKSSSTFGKWLREFLFEEKKMFWIPEGFDYGFVVLSKVAEFLYNRIDYDETEFACSIVCNDPSFSITWPIEGESRLLNKNQQDLPLLRAELFDSTYQERTPK